MPEAPDTAALSAGRESERPRAVLSAPFWMMMIVTALCLFGAAFVAAVILHRPEGPRVVTLGRPAPTSDVSATPRATP